MVQRDESFLTPEDHPLRAVEQHLRSAFRLWLEREPKLDHRLPLEPVLVEDRLPLSERPIDQFLCWTAHCFKSFIFASDTPKPASQRELCEVFAGPEIASGWYERTCGERRSGEDGSRRKARTEHSLEDADADELPLDPFEDLKRFTPRFHAVAHPNGETQRNADPRRQLKQAEFRDCLIALGQNAFHTRSIDFAVVLLELSASCFSQRSVLDGARMTEEYFVENARRWFQSAASARALQQSDSAAIAYSFDRDGLIFVGTESPRDWLGDSEDPEEKVETIPPAGDATEPLSLKELLDLVESETMEAAPLGDPPRTRFEEAVRANFTRTLNNLGFDGPTILSELDRYPNARQLTAKTVRKAIQRSKANNTTLAHELGLCGSESPRKS